MPFVRGQSGNPKGRNPKSRALTEILEVAGRQKMPTESGDLVEPRRLLARMLWAVLTTGETELPSGETLRFSAKDWLETAKFVYSQIDGPVKPQMPTEGSERPLKRKVFTLEDLEEKDERELMQLYREAGGET